MRRSKNTHAFQFNAWVCFVVITLMGWGMPGCVVTAAPPGPEVATDPDTSPPRRIASIQAYPAERVFELFELVAVSRHPLTVRAAAVDRMLDADADRFWQTAAARSAQVDDWPMIRLLCDRVSERREEAALPWLVKSWAAPSTTVEDRDRPERSALSALSRQQPEQALRDLFVQQADANGFALRASAWTVLMRVWGPDKLWFSVAGAAQDRSDWLLFALQQCARLRIKLPADREEVDRLLTVSLHDRLSSRMGTRWALRHRDDPAGPIQLRHIPAGSAVPLSRSAWSREQWLDRLDQRLAGRRHVCRGEHADTEIVAVRSERLLDHADRLNVGDFVVLDLMLDVLDDEALVAELFKQADADLRDTRTEYGGVLTWDGGDTLVVKPFDPLFKRHDQVYYARNECVEAMHTGLAHYHFHAQKHNNAVWAGPGKGDLGFADRLHANCVVFTFIDADTLNADAYFPGGIVVDLGCISR